MEQELKQRLAQLKGDILLAEKSLSQLQKDIEQHQTSKDRSLKQYDVQIREKKEIITNLTSQGEKLHALVILESQALQELQEACEKERAVLASDVQKAREEVKGVYEAAENRQKSVEDRENNVEIREEAVEEGRLAVEEGRLAVDSERSRLQLLDSELDTKRQEVDSKVERSNQTLAQTQELLDDIHKQIEVYKPVLEKLKTEIDEQTLIAQDIGIEADRKMKEAEKKLAQAIALSITLKKKEKELSDKEVWLADRERSLRRSYDEIVRRSNNG